MAVVLERGPAPVRPASGRTTRWALGGWAALVVVALVWGRSAGGAAVNLGAAPLVGHWDLHVGATSLAAVVVAVVVVGLGPRLAATVGWRRLPPLAGAAASIWAAALAVSQGWDRLTAPLTTRHEYEPFAATITSAPSFWRSYLARVPDLPVHVKGHPPGASLVPWALDRLGLSGAGWFALLVVLGWGVAVAASLVAMRAVAGEAGARRAAPALVLLPAALWAATSADALFAGVFALGIALVVARPGRRATAALGGAVLGVGLLLSYGGAVLVAIPIVVAVHRRRIDDLVVAGSVAGAVLVAAGLAGFWWPAGLLATRAEYWDGIASARPSAYLTLVGNPAALALAVGPAVVVGLVALVHRRSAAAVLPLAALAAVALADASQLSLGETERIWLPFVPWLVLAAPGDDRRWLAGQAGLAIGLQAVLRSPW